MLDELRESCHRLAQYLDDCRRSAEGVVENPVQQVLDGPREFTQLARTDHAPAALQGVERAPYGDQRVPLEWILVPGREEAFDLDELLVGLLDEELQQLRIGSLEHTRRRRAGLSQRRGPAACCSRAGEGLGTERRRRYLDGACKGGRLHRSDGWDRGCRLALQRVHARLRVVEHVPRIAASRLQRLHVVLDTDDSVCEPIQEPGGQALTARLHHSLELARDPLDDLDRTRLAQHEQSGLQAAHQLLPAVEAGRIESAADVLSDGLLDPCQVQDALAQNGRLHLLEFAVFAFLGLGRAPGADQSHELTVEAIFHGNQRGGDLHQAALVSFQGPLDDSLEAFGLLLHMATQLAQAEHTQRIADLAEHLDPRGQLLGLPGAASDEDVQNILDLGEILADRSRDRLHELHARSGEILALLLDR